MKKVEINKLPKSQVEIQVALPWEDVATFVDKAAKEYSEKHHIAGFRPGRAPKSAVEKEIGAHKLLHLAIELAVRDSYVKAVVENKVEVLGSPSIDVPHIHEGDDLKFKATVAVFPRLELCDVRALEFKKPKTDEIKVEDKELNAALTRLQRMRAKTITVNREAKKGDRVEVDFKLLLNGIPYEGGSGTNYPVVIGENQFLPDFEKNLIGMKSGEEKKFELTFPKDYYQQDLQNKTGEFEVKMKLVQNMELPELNDEFTQNVSKFKTFEEMKSSIKDGIRAEKKDVEIRRSLESLLEQIVEHSKVEIPEILIEEEKKKMLLELEGNVAEIGLTVDDYLHQLKKTKEEIMAGWNKEAAKRITVSLAFQELAIKEKLASGNDERIKQKVDEIMKATSPEQLQHLDPEQVKKYAEAVVLNERAIEWLKQELLKI